MDPIYRNINGLQIDRSIGEGDDFIVCYEHDAEILNRLGFKTVFGDCPSVDRQLRDLIVSVGCEEVTAFDSVLNGFERFECYLNPQSLSNIVRTTVAFAEYHLDDDTTRETVLETLSRRLVLGRARVPADAEYTPTYMHRMTDPAIGRKLISSGLLAIRFLDLTPSERTVMEAMFRDADEIDGGYVFVGCNDWLAEKSSLTIHSDRRRPERPRRRCLPTPSRARFP